MWSAEQRLWKNVVPGSRTSGGSRMAYGGCYPNLILVKIDRDRDISDII